MNMKTKIALLFSVAALVISVAYGAVMFRWNITNNVAIESDYSLGVYETDQVTECTTIDWGVVGLETVPYTVYVDNIGNSKVNVAWNHTEIPSGLVLEAYYGAGLNPLPINDFSIIELDPVDPMMRIKFFLTNEGADAGSFSFDILVMGADSSTG